MAPYYRNNDTDKTQFHPKSGLGATFNAVEIEETGKPVKPRTSLAPSKKEIAESKALLKDHSGTTKTTAAASGSGDSNKQEGAGTS